MQDDYEGMWNVVAFLLAFVCCVLQVNLHFQHCNLKPNHVKLFPTLFLPSVRNMNSLSCVHSATSTCSTHLWRNTNPSLCWVWSSYATSTCSAWGTRGSWFFIFQSPPSQPSSSSPVNSKTEPMTVGSEEERTGLNDRLDPHEDDVWIFNKKKKNIHKFCVIMENYNYKLLVLALCLYCFQDRKG